MLAHIEQQLAGKIGTVVRIALEVVGRISDLSVAIDQLRREIARLVAPLAPTLLALAGGGALTAVKLVGETAGVSHFRSRAAFARHMGTAPILTMAVPNCEYFEVLQPDAAQKYGLVQDIAVDGAGFVHAPTASGLGYEIDWDLVKRKKVAELR